MNAERPILIVDLKVPRWDGSTPAVAGAEQKADAKTDAIAISEFGCVVARQNGIVLDEMPFVVSPLLNPNFMEYCPEPTTRSEETFDYESDYRQMIRELDDWLSEWGPVVAWASWDIFAQEQILAHGRKYLCTPDFMEYPHIEIGELSHMMSSNLERNDEGDPVLFQRVAQGRLYRRGLKGARDITRLLPELNLVIDSRLP